MPLTIPVINSYKTDVDTIMTVLKMVDMKGNELGMIRLLVFKMIIIMLLHVHITCIVSLLQNVQLIVHICYFVISLLLVGLRFTVLA